ncbi:hypothetical protein WH47_04699 [Habropoda laboriosa]|uniref:Uncharacterized protein n=1 Tax=Habropoda laboriosa TaxID=597456 RepID=A0A0L7R2Q3_9HYME|nr:hypothetical protein WH47_04699 [Habropoda laboriosa]
MYKASGISATYRGLRNLTKSASWTICSSTKDCNANKDTFNLHKDVYEKKMLKITKDFFVVGVKTIRMI